MLAWLRGRLAILATAFTQRFVSGIDGQPANPLTTIMLS